MFAKQLRHYLFVPLIVWCFSALAEEERMWEYELQEGDTLWKISHDFLTDWRLWQKLQSLNKVAFDRKMAPGTRVSIPVAWLSLKEAPVKLIKSSGTVTVFDTSQQAVAINDQLRISEGYSLETEEASSALLLFADGSKLVVQQDTRIEFNTTATVGGGLVYNYEIGMPQGKVENRANPQRTPGSTFLIETPSSVTATRGTIYRVNTDGVKTGTEVTQGKVGVQNDFGEVAVAAGFGVITEKGKAPSQPVQLLPAPKLAPFMGRYSYIPANIEWPAIDGAASYVVQLATDDQFDLIAYEFTSDLALATLPLSLSEGRYFVRIRGVDGSGLEGKNAISELEYGEKPLTPLHVLDGEQPIYGTEEVALRWSESAGAKGYIVEVTPRNEDGNIVSRSLVLSSNEYRPRLKPGDYGWRVQIVEEDGSIMEYGHESRFTVVNAEYVQRSDAAPILHMPYAPPSQQLRYQFAKDADFTQISAEMRARGSRVPVHDDLEQGEYYIRYQVLNDDDEVSDTSPVYKVRL